MSQIEKGKEDSSDDESSDELSYNTADDSSNTRIKSQSTNKGSRISTDTVEEEKEEEKDCIDGGKEKEIIKDYETQAFKLKDDDHFFNESRYNNRRDQRGKIPCFGIQNKEQIDTPTGTANFYDTESSKRESDGPFQNVLEKDIEKLSNFVKPNEDETETFNSIFPIPIGVFWRRFLSNKAEYSCEDFYLKEGHKDITLSQWEPDLKNGGNRGGVDATIDNILDHKTRKLVRSIFMTIKVKGVPLHSKTFCILKYSLVKQPTKIDLRIRMETPKMPLGKKFNYQERWVIGTDSLSSNKVYVKMFVSLLHDKKIILKKNLEKRGQKEYPLLRGRWLEQINSKGLLCISQQDLEQYQKEDLKLTD
mmetsp:Transcript_10160/g.8963  ORF Transcript_10160/g.8963 Transcript_10160/m.8963 type:complete len:363 (-) Transcript_10160:253-1341(-)